ncbi:multidrug ABC transporter permease [Salinifilum aidingensis]
MTTAALAPRAALRRFGTALRLELRLQYRYRFLHAGVFSGLLWLAILLPMPRDLRSLAEPYVILGDLSIVGFFFIAGAVFFEKGERTVHALVVTPLRFSEYLASKVVLLTALSTVLALVVATVAHGPGYHPAPLVAGAVLGTVIMLLVSFASSMPFASVSDWYLPSMLPLALCTLPIFPYSGVWQSWWFALIPTYGPLHLLGAAFDQVALPPGVVAYALLYPVVCAAVLWWFAGRLFTRCVVARSGGV